MSKAGNIDLVEMAREGKLTPVIGRDAEINRCIEILSRKTKNNPLLLGEPGVGKTAICEGLAQWIVKGHVPPDLNGKLISLDIGGLIAGAGVRGDFERRLKDLLEEIKNSGGHGILFIDEIHMIVGAGRQGPMDMANLLKPMLGRGELRCIGATTIGEYRKYIRQDPALERRFQPVYVDPPTVEDTITILWGLRDGLESYHGVSILDTALKAAAVLSDRYIKGRFLPDKAIDLVDEAAAKLKMQMASKPLALDEVNQGILRLEMEKLLPRAESEQIEQELSQLKVQQSDMNDRWDHEKKILTRIKSTAEKIDKKKLEIQQGQGKLFSHLIARKRARITTLEQELEVARQELADYRISGNSLFRTEVTADDITEIVTKWVGIPLLIKQSDMEALSRFEDELHKHVVGQDYAVEAVADAILQFRAGFSDPDRPIASFMFMGPPGVGKTELAKALAVCLFKSKEAIVRIDMSEYMERVNVSRLIGAAPGYVGYDEGGQLTEMVRRKPYSVVLFDEIEKAHPDVNNLFLQILNDARVTDSQGQRVDFSNTVVIMTSNVGSEHIVDSDHHESLTKEMAYQTMKQKVMEAAKKKWKPEFIDRMDEFIVFQPLDRGQINQIVRLQLCNVEEKLAYRNIQIEFTDAAVDLLASLGYSPNSGARPVKRVIREFVQRQLAKSVVKGEIKDNDKLLVDTDNGQLVFIKSVSAST